MLEFLTNQPRFIRINMELLVGLLLVSVLALVAFRRLDDLREGNFRAQAQAVLESGRAAVSLNFAHQLVSSGAYDPPFTGTAGTVMTSADRARLEAMLAPSPIYPPGGPYDSPTGAGYRWYLVSAGSKNPPTVPVITALTDSACPATESFANPPEADDDCDVHKF